MLFDLKGRRRRVVQVTYLTLAVLMGGGLVLFGIGGDVSGGLFDAFSDRSGSTSGLVEDRIEDSEKRLEQNPRDKAALAALVRDWYQLANDEADVNTRQYTEEGLNRLGNADEAWQRYLEVEQKKPDPALAQLMTQVYDPAALNKPAKAAEAAEIFAVENRGPQAYVNLAYYATLARQTRKADLAGKKAIALAPKSQRPEVRASLRQLEQLTTDQGAPPTGETP